MFYNSISPWNVGRDHHPVGVYEMQQEESGFPNLNIYMNTSNYSEYDILHKDTSYYINLRNSMTSTKTVDALLYAALPFTYLAVFWDHMDNVSVYRKRHFTYNAFVNWVAHF